jgi:hypothetical protein
LVPSYSGVSIEMLEGSVNIVFGNDERLLEIKCVSQAFCCAGMHFS